MLETRRNLNIRNTAPADHSIEPSFPSAITHYEALKSIHHSSEQALTVDTNQRPRRTLSSDFFTLWVSVWVLYSIQVKSLDSYTSQPSQPKYIPMAAFVALLQRQSISSDVNGVKQTFSSWDNCMSKAYCKCVNIQISIG